MVVSCRGADKFAGVLGEILYDGLRIFFLQRFAGDNDRAGIDVCRHQACFPVSRLNTLLHLLEINQRPCKIRGQHDLGAIEDLTVGHGEAS